MDEERSDSLATQRHNDRPQSVGKIIGSKQERKSCWRRIISDDDEDLEVEAPSREDEKKVIKSEIPPVVTLANTSDDEEEPIRYFVFVLQLILFPILIYSYFVYSNQSKTNPCSQEFCARQRCGTFLHFVLQLNFKSNETFRFPKDDGCNPYENGGPRVTQQENAIGKKHSRWSAQEAGKKL